MCARLPRISITRTLAKSRKRLNAGLCPTQDECVNVVRALVGVHHFEIHEMANHAEFVRNAVAAQHVARGARHIERLAAGIAFEHGSDFDGSGSLILHAPEAQTPLQRQSDFGLHVDQLLLNELIGGERTAKLLAIQHVLPCRMPAALRGAERAPGYAVAGRIEASEWALEAG